MGGEKFREMANSAMDGVIFIDEAYSLDPNGDFKGKPIVDELMVSYYSDISWHFSQLKYKPTIMFLTWLSFLFIFEKWKILFIYHLGRGRAIYSIWLKSTTTIALQSNLIITNSTGPC